MNGAAVNDLNWDDVRVFLATLRARSLREAAEHLGVSRPTAGRRLSALEQRLGLLLFDRRNDGLHPTPQALGLLEAAEGVERSMLTLSRAARVVDPDLRGPVHVTLPGVIASSLLMEDLVEFCARWPQIELHIDSDYRVSDLDKRAADVAVRFVPHGQTPDEHLTGRLAGTVWVAAYGSGERWLGQRRGPWDRRWVQESAFPDLPLWGSINDGEIQRAACAAGLGRATLPCFYAEPMLTRCSEPRPGFDIWVLVHPDLRRDPRLRVFRDFVVEACRKHEARLRGS